jgi:hypothetical protein
MNHQNQTRTNGICGHVRYTVERGHDSGSMMVMGWGGAMRVGERTRSAEQERCAGAKASAARERKCKGRRRRMLRARVKKTTSPPSIGFIDPRDVLSRAHALHALTTGKKPQSLTGGTHHDRGSRTPARALSLRRGNRMAAAGGHVRLPTSPTPRGAAAPEKARPRCKTAAATTRI